MFSREPVLAGSGHLSSSRPGHPANAWERPMEQKAGGIQNDQAVQLLDVRKLNFGLPKSRNWTLE
jgi:hypothetical protein